MTSRHTPRQATGLPVPEMQIAFPDIVPTVASVRRKTGPDALVNIAITTIIASPGVVTVTRADSGFATIGKRGQAVRSADVAGPG